MRAAHQPYKLIVIQQVHAFSMGYSPRRAFFCLAFTSSGVTMLVHQRVNRSTLNSCCGPGPQDGRAHTGGGMVAASDVLRIVFAPDAGGALPERGLRDRLDDPSELEVVVGHARTVSACSRTRRAGSQL